MAVTLSQQAEVSVRYRAGGGGSPLTAAPEPLAVTLYLYESRRNEDYSGKCKGGSGEGPFTGELSQL